jgi:hypothetical protein
MGSGVTLKLSGETKWSSCSPVAFPELSSDSLFTPSHFHSFLFANICFLHGENQLCMHLCQDEEEDSQYSWRRQLGLSVDVRKIFCFPSS